MAAFLANIKRDLNYLPLKLAEQLDDPDDDSVDLDLRFASVVATTRDGTEVKDAIVVPVAIQATRDEIWYALRG